MEGEPNTENVVYIDEFPELRKRVWLRRLNAQRHLGVITIAHEGELVEFPDPTDPDGAA
jgi:hypothetical protein